MLIIILSLVFFIGCFTEEERYTFLLITIEPDNNGDYEVVIPLIVDLDSEKPFFENSSIHFSEGKFILSYVNTPYGIGLKINSSGPVTLKYRTDMNINIGYSLDVNSPIQSINKSSQSKCWIYFYSDEVNEISFSYYCYNGLYKSLPAGGSGNG